MTGRTRRDGAVAGPVSTVAQPREVRGMGLPGYRPGGADRIAGATLSRGHGGLAP